MLIELRDVLPADEVRRCRAALLGAQCYAGWGGLIVLPVVEGKGGFIAGLAVGAIVSAACVILLKALAKKKTSDAKADDEMDLDFEIN